MENNNAKKGIDWSMQREAECSNYELVQSNYHNENILNCNFDRIDKKMFSTKVQLKRYLLNRCKLFFSKYK